MKPIERARAAQASFEIRLVAPPDAAFPMFDPVNETKWDPSWQPQLLSDRVAEGLIFLVGSGDSRATWILDLYDPVAHRVGYVAVGRSLVTRISIRLRESEDGSVATVDYTKTALDRDGEDAVADFERHFTSQGPHWESAINAALTREAP